MSSSGVRHHVSLLSEFVPAIFGALGLGIPIAVAIIWICSDRHANCLLTALRP